MIFPFTAALDAEDVADSVDLEEAAAGKKDRGNICILISGGFAMDSLEDIL